MYVLNVIGEALITVIKWVSIVATSILAPSIGVLAIIKVVIKVIKSITSK